MSAFFNEHLMLLELTLVSLVLVGRFSIGANSLDLCTCECCLDDDSLCQPTFRSTISIGPHYNCTNETCDQEACLVFAQCSLAFGYSGNLNKVTTKSTEIYSFL